MQENLARSDEMNTRGSCVGGGVGVVVTAGEERFTRPVCARRFDLASGNGADRITRRVRLATGVTVPYLEQGDPQAAAVLLLHEWVESSACFDRLLQAMRPTLRVFAMDQSGHGDAAKPADGYALVNFADDIAAFMDAVGLQSAVLLGSSSGGYVAQQVAVQVPHRVDGLVSSAHRAAFRAGQPLPTRWVGSPTLSIPVGLKNR
jgi:pimeloyl-ACP methyl ester carboxylesterase